MEKLKSRKLWMAIVNGLIVVANDGLGLNLDSTTILAFTGMVSAYILGQSHVDAKKASSDTVG